MWLDKNGACFQRKQVSPVKRPANFELFERLLRCEWRVVVRWSLIFDLCRFGWEGREDAAERPSDGNKRSHNCRKETQIALEDLLHRNDVSLAVPYPCCYCFRCTILLLLFSIFHSMNRFTCANSLRYVVNVSWFICSLFCGCKGMVCFGYTEDHLAISFSVFDRSRIDSWVYVLDWVSLLVNTFDLCDKSDSSISDRSWGREDSAVEEPLKMISQSLSERLSARISWLVWQEIRTGRCNPANRRGLAVRKSTPVCDCRRKQEQFSCNCSSLQ